ncbi:Cell division protein FtsW [Anaerohalosphaera lusitana]|uniref:Cell wall polymerase n=1 Tax=Anaerohalosphaera lusitana TaxID=1936003 RepID=A0A1U9NHI3_9BACT|nr:FtsW/RodA/SpoVE family cell cycle protein [Anaerohalosphaera lusitana]AQT67070.1 Cell division protein FtsW [Anaerohalosphaera lusitana]
MKSFLHGRLVIVRLIMLAAMLSLVAIGIATIYASGHPAEVDEASKYAGAWKKQAVYAAGGMMAFIFVNLFDYRKLGPLSYWLYGGILAVLAVLLLGKRMDIPFVPVINGTCRWIRLGIGSRFVQVQPSEFCKIIYILALAWYLRFRKNYRQFHGLIGPFALTLLAMVLILFEPDLGTVLLMMPILFSMLYVAGAKPKHLLTIVALGVISFPFLWGHMNHYQRQRISCVLLQSDYMKDLAQKNGRVAEVLTGNDRFNPKAWERGNGWQLKHSKLAIASGGIKGYGWRKGPYIKYNTLPERHNDFIFAIIAHQWGLIGCAVVLGLYAVLIGCANEIAWANTDAFARLVTVGIMAMFTVEVIVNISMTLGLMPITGLTLPFVSYGGSSLVVSMMAVGLLNNIGRERPFSVAGRAFENV